MMSERIRSIEVFPLQIPRDVPYLGPLEPGVAPSARGYFVRPGNRTLYSIHDHIVLVKLTTESGAVGWGECFGVVSPRTVATILQDLGEPFVVGRDPHDGLAITEDIYDGMRVRGFFGGFYVDALAGIDIALWDLRGKLTGLPLCKLLGGQRHDRLAVYVSGLPEATRDARAELAAQWIAKGFHAVKFAAAVAHEGEAAEMEALRAAVGPAPKILVDFHWRYTDHEAIKLITQLEDFDLFVAEAPVQSEDLEGQAAVARAVKTPIAIGEELRTVYEYRPRFVKRCMSIIQPEMAHMGVTFFWQVCQMAQAFHCRVMPHATIGVGIAQAASLHVSAALNNFSIHEYHYSRLDFVQSNVKVREILGEMKRQGSGVGSPPMYRQAYGQFDADGHGVRPRERVCQISSCAESCPLVVESRE